MYKRDEDESIQLPDVLIRKLYFIQGKEVNSEILLGNGYRINYKNLSIKRCFDFKWNKNVGLEVLKVGGNSDFILSRNKNLTYVLMTNHRRLWRKD